MAAIANGYADNLITRVADIALKQRKKLIIVPRETPLNVIHLENMLKLAKMGAIILPACPGFYSKPKSIDDLVNFIISRILDLLGIENSLIRRWGEK
jgi:4-hydroxy-3-polyprenylbenzoate decarboxylase